MAPERVPRPALKGKKLINALAAVSTLESSFLTM